MNNIKNFFKFLEDKEGKNPPLRYKFFHDPESLTPEDLNIRGDLDLFGEGITSLPDNLTVRGDLDLENTKIKTLPDNLTVGGYLNLRGSKIDSFPNNLKIGSNLYLYNTSLGERYTKEEIRKMIEGKGGFVGGKVYF